MAVEVAIYCVSLAYRLYAFGRYRKNIHLNRSGSFILAREILDVLQEILVYKL